MRQRLCLSGLLAAMIFVLTPMASAQPSQDPSDLWADFNHYVLVARPDLAMASATALLNRVNGQELLDIAENSDYKDYATRTLPVAMRIESLKSIAERIDTMLDTAKLERSREPQRIRNAIERLGDGARANLNARRQLSAAGQFAAPQMLDALLSEDDERLHPYIVEAMEDVGRSLVYPLSEALPQLETVPTTQVARVLGNLGYPRALPYLKLAAEKDGIDPHARTVVEAAFRRIVSRLDADISLETPASELFLQLGRDYYLAGTAGDTLVGYDQSTGQGMVWSYDRKTGLVMTAVPGNIYPDVLAMRAGRQSLDLNPDADQSLSLWLTANLRRENRLPAGETDPSYGYAHEPAYYVLMAGPQRQLAVLQQALTVRDVMLALDAIAALADTAGPQTLLGEADAGQQPVLKALSDPNRQIRFRAAETLAKARPRSPFPADDRVVPVLSEAVRQSDQLYAVAIGKDQTSTNRLTAALREFGFEVFGATELGETLSSVNAAPGVDLIVVDGSAERILRMIRQTTDVYKLTATPVLAVVGAVDQVAVVREYRDDPRVSTTNALEDDAQLTEAIESIMAESGKDAISPDQADEFAITALTLLNEIAIGSGQIFNAADAEGALIEAIGDERIDVAILAAEVLSRLDSTAAQEAIAEVALDEDRDPEVRVAALNSLARSARTFGNQLSRIELDGVLEMVKTSQGEMALAAGRAHGALTLPTSNLVDVLRSE